MSASCEVDLARLRSKRAVVAPQARKEAARKALPMPARGRNM